MESVIKLLRETEDKEELAKIQLSMIENNSQNNSEENRNLKRQRESTGTANKPTKRRKKNDHTAVYKTIISDQRRGGIPVQIEKPSNNRSEWSDDENNDIENLEPGKNDQSKKQKNNDASLISSK